MPPKSSPRSFWSRSRWRSAAIRKIAAVGVVAVQSGGCSPAVTQPLSSMLTAWEPSTVATNAWWGSANAVGGSSSNPGTASPTESSSGCPRPLPRRCSQASYSISLCKKRSMSYVPACRGGEAAGRKRQLRRIGVTDSSGFKSITHLCFAFGLPVCAPCSSTTWAWLTHYATKRNPKSELRCEKTLDVFRESGFPKLFSDNDPGGEVSRIARAETLARAAMGTLRPASRTREG